MAKMPLISGGGSSTQTIPITDVLDSTSYINASSSWAVRQGNLLFLSIYTSTRGVGWETNAGNFKAPYVPKVEDTWVAATGETGACDGVIAALIRNGVGYLTYYIKTPDPNSNTNALRALLIYPI